MRALPVSTALVCALFAGCGGSAEAHKILLIPSGSIEASQDSRLMRAIGDELDEMGFEVVHDPEVLPAVDADAARARAAKVDAAHPVVIALDAGKERPGAVAGSHLWSVEATAHVFNAVPQHPVPAPYAMEFVHEDTSATAMATRARETWVAAFAPFIADAALHSPQLEQVMQGEGDTRALLAITDLKKYEDLIRSRHKLAEEYAAFCTGEAERVAELAAGEGLTCHGNPCGQYALVGVNAAGRPVAQDLSRVPIFTAPPERKGYWSEPPERVFVIEADGSERDLMRAGNFYGIGTVRQGHAVGTIESFTSEGSSVVWGFSTEDGDVEKKVLLGPGERNGVSEVSPDGAWALWCHRDGGMCHVQGEASTVELPALSWGRFGRAGEQLVIAGMDRKDRLVLVDPAAPGQVVPIGAKGRLREIVGAPDEGIALMVRDERGDCALITASVGGEVLATQAMPQCIGDATLVADGRVVGTAVVSHPDDIPGDAEVVVWTPGTDVLFPLTSGAFREEIVYPSPDGKAVFFNRRLKEPEDPRFDTRVYRRVVCEVELPPK